MDERVEYFKSQNKLIEAQRIQERTNFDIEMMKETGFCQGIENYSRHIRCKIKFNGEKTMNKEQIDKIMQIINIMKEDFNYMVAVEQLSEFCKSEEIKIKLNEILNVINQNTESLRSLQYNLEEMFREIVKNTNLQKPEDLAKFFQDILRAAQTDNELMFIEDDKIIDIAKSIDIDTQNKLRYFLNEIKKKEKNYEQLEENVVMLFSEIGQEIFSQVPEDLLSYFYAECYELELDGVFFEFNKDKEEIAQKTWDERIERILDKKTSDEKIKIIKENIETLNSSFIKERWISHLTDIEKKELVKEVDDIGTIEEIIKLINDSNLKIKAIKEIKKEEYKFDLIKYFMSENITDYEIQTEIRYAHNAENFIKIIKTLDFEYQLMALDYLNEDQKLKIIRTIRNQEKTLKAIDKLELEDKQKERLRNMFQKNNSVLENIDIRMLDDYYINTLGEDKINLISCFPDIQEQVLELGEKEYQILVKVIQNYIEDNETDEWTIIGSSILKNLREGQYSELIANIEDTESIDIEKLSKIMQFSNNFEIKTIEDVENYEEIKRKKCDEIISSSSSSLDDKKNVVFLKIFGQDIEFVKKTIEEFGEDIHCIKDEGLKYYVEAINMISQIDDEETLIQIYNKCEEIDLIDTTSITRQLKNAYGKKFNEGLYQPKEEDTIKEEELPNELKDLGLRVYDAGTDFRMMITSVAPFVENNPEDFKKDWNRPELGSQHVCCSYIRHDMQGTAGIPHLCYGFSELKDDALMLSGASDIYSSGKSFVSSAGHKERYYSPNNQINKTQNYNEMCIRRNQGGEKKQPDYIVAFKTNRGIENIEKIIKASQDWDGKLPIVIIDIEKCLSAERIRVNEMLKEYEVSKSHKKAREIIQKVENNRITCRRWGGYEFCLDIEEQLEQIRRDIEEQEKAQTDLRQNYDCVSAEERREGVSAVKK